MKCPMRRWNWVNKSGEVREDLAKCEKEACAWWDEEKNSCSIKVIAKESSRAQLALSNTDSKTPLGG